MSKRNLATGLWFLMGWVLGSMLAIVVGLPALAGILLGIPFAAFIRVGPGSRLWAAQAQAHQPATAGVPGATLATE